MKPNDASDYFDKRLKQMHKYYNALLKDFDVDDIHEFRLAYKKMRALNRLRNAGLSRDAQIKIGKKIKNIYQKTGLIRNHQLHETRIHDLAKDLMVPMPVDYIAYLKNEKENLITEVKAKSRFISFRLFQLNMDNDTHQTIDKKAIKNFIAQKQIELSQLLSVVRFTDNDFHTVRKILKDILYTEVLINGNSHPALEGALSDVNNIEALTTKLGDFHDLCVTIDFFNPTIISFVEDENEKQVLFFMKEQFEWSKQHLQSCLQRDLMIIKNKLFTIQEVATAII